MSLLFIFNKTRAKLVHPIKRFCDEAIIDAKGVFLGPDGTGSCDRQMLKLKYIFADKKVADENLFAAFKHKKCLFS